jgi:hypothetical protein
VSVGVMLGLVEGLADRGAERWDDPVSSLVVGLTLGAIDTIGVTDTPPGLVNSVQESASKSKKPSQPPFFVDRLLPASMNTAGPATEIDSGRSAKSMLVFYCYAK